MKTLAKRLASSVIAFAATLALAVAMSSPASAATTYTPGGAPNVNFGSSNASFQFIQANQTFTCAQFGPAGEIVNAGTRRAVGTNGVVLTSFASSGCTNPIWGTTTYAATETSGLTVTGDAVGSIVPVRFTGLEFVFTGAACSFKVGGVLNGTFDTGTQRFTPVDGASGLKVTSTPTGHLCPILGMAVGHDLKLGGTWTNTPPAGSGPLTIAVP